MNPKELEFFEKRLQAKARELSQLLRSREHINVEPAADPIDEIQGAAARELAIVNLDRDSALLSQVHRALERIQEGEYGLCEDCGEPISPRRLQAISWATRCIHCQEAVERTGEGPVESAGPDSDRPRFSRAA